MHSAKCDKRKAGRLLPLALALLCFVIPLFTLAQGPPDPEDTPIDGGLSLLLAAGAAYGIKQYRDVKKIKKNMYDQQLLPVQQFLFLHFVFLFG
jgi:hypothetical protein